MWVSCACHSPPLLVNRRFQSTMRQDCREPQTVYSTRSGPAPPTLPAIEILLYRSAGVGSAAVATLAEVIVETLNEACRDAA